MDAESTYEPTIIRTPHNRDNPYFMMTRAAAQDESLSWAARGVLAYLLSKPGHWRVQVSDLEQQCGRDKVYAILKELVDTRYMERILTRRTDGRFGAYEYRVYETPLPEKPDTVSPDTVNPLLDSIENTEDKKEKREKSAPPKSGHSNGEAKGKKPIPPSYAGFENGNDAAKQAWLDTWHQSCKAPPVMPTGTARLNALDQVDSLQKMGYTVELWGQYIAWREAKGKSTVWRWSVEEAHMYPELSKQNEPAKPAPKAFQPQYIQSENVTMIMVNGQYQYVSGDQRAAYAVTGENDHE